MRRLSLKTKITMLYTTIMTLVVLSVLILLFSFSNQEILTGVQNQLEETVAGAIGDIEYQDGMLKIDSDFLELENGIYLSLYSSDGTLLYGKIPYGFDNSAPFQDGSIRRMQGAGSSYYLMDMVYTIPGYGVVDIRGVASVTAAERSFYTTIRLAAILLPLIVLVTAVMGYFMTKRTLRPVSKITDTVQSIRKDKDLSRRIHLGEGNDEIYRMAATFDQLLEQIEDSRLREQQFTSDVAHELRTPLSTMMLMCEDMMTDDALDDSAKENVSLLHQKVIILSRMVSQLLTLSRADQGRAKIEKEHINISELALSALEEARELALPKNIAIESDIAPGITMIGDETLLIRFFLNLLTNAVSYGKTNGHIRVGLQSCGDLIRGEVQDDGIGIGDKDLPHIWERFYQADASRTEKESSGLGLSMVRWIVDVHGGTIDVDSKIGEGSCFYFSFPVNPKTEAPHP